MTGTMEGNAIEVFDLIQAKLSGKTVVVFLDYDGTLSPIVANPDEAFMSDQMRNIVRKVAATFPSSIVTGRGKDKVFNFIKLEELFYVGSHGFDIFGPTTGIGSDVRYEACAEELPVLQQLYKHLDDSLKTIPGAWVEDNHFSLSVHYRECIMDDIPRIEEIVDGYLTSSASSLNRRHGKKVIEIRPAIEWHKGKAVMYLLKEMARIFGWQSMENVFPVYLGDDITDEDAFASIVEEWGQGVPILIAEDPNARPTKANFTLRNPTEVLHFLTQLVTIIPAAH